MRFRFLLIIASLFFMPCIAAAHEGGEKTHTVRVSESGFEPSSLEIEQGETVTFINVGTKPHWPASDIHPTHGIYPAFDPKRSLTPGGKWSFTFNRAGRWNMHDHVQAASIGEILVKGDGETEDNSEPIDEVVSFGIFEKMGIALHRWYYALLPSRRDAALAELSTMELTKDERGLQLWVRLVGAEMLLEDILSETGGGATLDCHQEAHQLGHAAYAIEGARAFREGDASCHSGFYHGAMEVLLQQEGTEDIVGTVREICREFPTQFGIFECLHGVGHGLLAYQRYDLPAAIQNCHELETNYDRSSCDGGVFMENIVTGQGRGASDDHDTAWVSDDPHFPCNALEPDPLSLEQCYLMQTSWMLTLFQYDQARVAQECLRAPKDMIPVCFKSYGRDAAGLSLRDPVQIRAACDKVADVSGKEQCVLGALNVIIDFWGPKLTDQAAVFCQSIGEEFKTSCYGTLAGRLPEIVDGTRQAEICRLFEEPYRSACRS